VLVVCLQCCCQVLSIDEDIARVIVSLAVSSGTMSVSQYAIKLVTKTEFDKFSKCLSELLSSGSFTYTQLTIAVKIFCVLPNCDSSTLLLDKLSDLFMLALLLHCYKQVIVSFQECIRPLHASVIATLLYSIISGVYNLMLCSLGWAGWVFG